MCSENEDGETDGVPGPVVRLPDPPPHDSKGTRPEGPRHGSPLHDPLCLHQDSEEFRLWAITMAMVLEKASSRELLLTQPFF